MSGGLMEGQTPVATVEQTSPPGMRVKKLPDVFQQNVPGYTIYGIFWIVSLLAVSVLREKQEGTFRRLLVAPMGRMVMLAGKLMPYYLINIVQGDHAGSVEPPLQDESWSFTGRVGGRESGSSSHSYRPWSTCGRPGPHRGPNRRPHRSSSAHPFRSRRLLRPTVHHA